jgi:hypothetical protein
MIGGSSSGGGWEFSSSPQHPDWLWGPHSLLSNGYSALSLGIKLPGREADHSPPSSAAVKNAWAIPPLLNTPSSRGAQLNHRAGVAYDYFIILWQDNEGGIKRAGKYYITIVFIICSLHQTFG